MLAMKSKTITTSFLGFASKASHVLHIKSVKDYEEALRTIEYLFEQSKDTLDDPLNDLIDIISRAIGRYESIQNNLVRFESKVNEINQEISVLRMLMDQHDLTVSGFKGEIGSKSLVSMILNGKRNLTKDHIAKLSKRFNLSPSVFFSVNIT